MNDMQNPEDNLQKDEVVSVENVVETNLENEARLSTAELQATLERLEALTTENVALRAAAETLQGEKDRLEDSWKRSEAEMANLRRRTEREIAENAKYAISSFAKDVIGIGDNLRRAIDAVPKDAVANDPALSTLLEGVEVTERELFKVLERQNIVRFNPVGEKFDPHVHEAMMHVATSAQPPETIVQVFQAGYMLGERVLRAAAVVVAKAGVEAPKGGPTRASRSEETSSEEKAASSLSEVTEAPTTDISETLQREDETDARGANVLNMQRRGSAEKAPPRRAQIIRPVTATTSVLSTKKSSSVMRPVMGQAAQAQSEKPLAVSQDPEYADYDEN
ncbi:MAG: nucleotide exchange factor GrpE [Hyphomicrobiales bacterium]|nr:nucleotide exchange factor GrpE [Hyphomicrobiales bacterium]